MEGSLLAAAKQDGHVAPGWFNGHVVATAVAARRPVTPSNRPPATNGQPDDFSLGCVYAYENGAWRKLADDPLYAYLAVDESPDRGWSPEAAFRRAGYSPPRSDQSAIECSGLIIRQAIKPTPLSRQYRFVVELSATLDDVDVVYVLDLPSLMQLLPGLVAIRQIAQADVFDDTLAEVRRGARGRR